MMLRNPDWPLKHIPEKAWRNAFKEVRDTYLAQMLNPGADWEDIYDWRQRALSLHEIESALMKSLLTYIDG